MRRGTSSRSASGTTSRRRWFPPSTCVQPWLPSRPATQMRESSTEPTPRSRSECGPPSTCRGARGRRSLLGTLLGDLGIEIVCTWKAVLVAAMVMSFPLLVRSARTAFEEVDPRLVGIARTLGCGPARAFFRVTLPLAWRGILAGSVLAFSRALGEFGATVMVAGNIPGRTQTLPLAIFHYDQIGRDDRALALVGVTVVLAFVALWSAELVSRRRSGRTAA